MADEIERLQMIRQELEGLNKTFKTTQVVKVDVDKIKRQITEELKRELQGRSSYGIGV